MRAVAIRLNTDGTADPVLLEKDEGRLLIQLRELVGGDLEVLPLDEAYMVLNERGKTAPHSLNREATDIAHEAHVLAPGDYIAGAAVLVPAAAML